VAGHSSVRTFVSGTSSTFSFTTGGSKDPNLISSWAYSSGNTPNKDTLNGAYAAAYTIGGDFELVFGADRASPSGDANIGIWFFQNAVGPNGSGGFTGAHVNHDVFIISAFTGGGGNSTVTVLEWDSGCASGVKNPTAGQCADTNLRLLAVPSGVCGSSIYCGITNSGTVNSTWEGSLLSPLFFEGGVDLTAAFAAVGVTQLPCFSSFLVETRSSQSTTAVLKDFLAGGFPVCSAFITKSCGTPTEASDGSGTTFPVNGIVTNTGIGALHNVRVFDAVSVGTSSSTHTITVVNNTLVNGNHGPNYGTDTLGANETGTWSDSVTANAASETDVAYAQGAIGSSVIPNGTCTQSGTVCSSNQAQVSCSTSYTGSLGVTKNCGIPNSIPANVVPGVTLTVSGTTIGVSVNVSGIVYNNSPSPLTGVVLHEAPASGTAKDITIGSLAACLPATAVDANGNCTVAGASKAYSDSYTPTNIDTVVPNTAGNPSEGPGRYFWADQVTITSATATLAGTTLHKIAATDVPTPPTYCDGTYGCASTSCPICQGSSECTTQ
jgi:hypothetical protein